MQFRVMLPLLPGMWLALMPVQGQGWMFGVPLGPPGAPALAAGVGLLRRGGRGGLTATAPLPGNERIIFGRSS